MNVFRITIEQFNGFAPPPEGRWTKRAQIVCNSEYTLVEDVTDWVLTEIDGHAFLRREDFSGENTEAKREGKDGPGEEVGPDVREASGDQESGGA